MREAAVVDTVALIACHQAAEMAEPGKEALDQAEAALVALGDRVHATLAEHSGVLASAGEVSFGARGRGE